VSRDFGIGVGVGGVLPRGGHIIAVWLADPPYRAILLHVHLLSYPLLSSLHSSRLFSSVVLRSGRLAGSHTKSHDTSHPIEYR
jgi:hypothetical protein